MVFLASGRLPATALKWRELMFLLICALPSVAAADDAPAPVSAAPAAQAAGKNISDDQRKSLLDAWDRLDKESGDLHSAGKLEEAIVAAEKMLAIDTQLYGTESDTSAKTLNWIGDRQADLALWSAARQSYRDQVAMLTKLHGPDHWLVTSARLDLNDIDILEKLTPDQRQSLRQALDELNQVGKLTSQGKYQDAEKLAQHAGDVEKSLLGEAHWKYSFAINWLGYCFENEGEFAKAEPLYQQILAIRKKSVGEKHPDYAGSLNGLGALYNNMGDYAKAEPLFKQALAIRKETLGEKNIDYSVSLNNLASVYMDTGKYSQAEPLYEEAIAIKKEVLGEKDPDYAMGLNNLAELCSGQGNYVKAELLYQQALAAGKEAWGEKHPDYAMCLGNLSGLYNHMGNYAKAETLQKQALAIYKETLGEKHPQYAGSLTGLALIDISVANYAPAEALLKQAMAIDREALGEKHPRYISDVNNLAGLYETMGNYAAAEPMYKQAAEIRKEVLGENHPDYARSLNNLAGLYKDMGNYAQAEPLLKQALAIYKEVFGKNNIDYGHSLFNLAALYERMGDDAKAESLYKQAGEIYKAVLGEQHPDYALCLNSLGNLYWNMGDRQQAEPLYKQALAIRKKVLGEKHPEYAASLDNLASMYEKTGDYAQAEPLFKQAVAIDKEALGEKNPAYATELNNLAALYMIVGNYAGAEPLYQQAMAIFKEVQGEYNPDYATSVNNLALLYDRMGNWAQAERLSHEGLQISLRNLELAAAVQSERQQLRMADSTRAFFNMYLAEAQASGAPADRAYAEVLGWKGSVSSRQLVMRQLRTGQQDPKVAELYDQLAETARQLDSLSRAVPKPDQAKQHAEQLLQLSDTVESLQQKLATASSNLESMQQRCTPADLQKALPADTVLVDFLEHWDYKRPSPKGKPPEFEPKLAAFVVCANQPLQWIDLGPTEPINAAVDHWRQSYSAADGAELRHLVWQPLDAKIGDAKTVLISPDGSLDRFPFAALPGKNEGTYLIEDVALATVPIPRLLPKMLAEAAKAPSAKPSLLTVGDVDFKAPLQSTAPTEQLAAAPVNANSANLLASLNRGAVGWQFGPLEGTRVEISAINDSFGHRFPDSQRKSLAKDGASKQAVCEAMPHYNYLHLATHGFFAPPMVAGAGVNLEAVEKKLVITKIFPGGAADHDGRLKAGDEVLAVASGDGDWMSTEGKTVADTVGVTRGPVGTKVRIRVKPAAGGEAIEYVLTRQPFMVATPTNGMAYPGLDAQAQFAGAHPDLLVGLALAGANQRAEPGQEDGILTALEVESLDLRKVNLVVLSACETGLGQTATGEGVLGLQRAFQMAGARTTATSLWSVDDNATQTLMVEFYKRLWDKDYPLGKLEALRQAQLAMLHSYDPHSGKIANRGLELDEAPTSTTERLSPRYWAAFELSGDWR